MLVYHRVSLLRTYKDRRGGLGASILSLDGCLDLVDLQEGGVLLSHFLGEKWKPVYEKKAEFPSLTMIG